MRRAGVVLAGIVLVFVVAACGNAGQIWQDEFDARLEGASGVIEEADEAVAAKPSAGGWPEVFIPLSRTLNFKAGLIDGLDPPDGCEKVQEEGLDAVGGFAGNSYILPRSMTAELEHELPSILEEVLAHIEDLEREAENCAKS